jgi:hypothetical protein
VCDRDDDDDDDDDSWFYFIQCDIMQRDLVNTIINLLVS